MGKSPRSTPRINSPMNNGSIITAPKMLETKKSGFSQALNLAKNVNTFRRKTILSLSADKNLDFRHIFGSVFSMKVNYNDDSGITVDNDKIKVLLLAILFDLRGQRLEERRANKTGVKTKVLKKKLVVKG